MRSLRQSKKWLVAIICALSLFGCKYVEEQSSIKLSEAESISAEPLDPDLMLVDKTLRATLNCISPNSRVVFSGSARITPNQKRLAIKMGNISFSVSQPAVCHIDIRGKLMNIAGMAKVPLSNSPLDDLLYTSVRVPVSKADNPQDFLDELSFFYKVFEIDAEKVDQLAEKDSNGKDIGRVKKVRDAINEGSIFKDGDQDENDESVTEDQSLLKND